MTAGSCLAAFSGGMALQQPNVGLFAVLGIVIGASVSYALRIILLRSWLIKVDGFLYALAVIAGAVFAPQLQQFMPDGGYPVDVVAASWLTCMLILGSFFTWQDSTILFQAVPAISLFALAGIYSTWSGVNFAFFGFLICLATLVSRAHRRAMLVQAAESGYFTRGLAPGSIAPSVETTPGLARRMQEGPWKWIAGPEWALLGALAIALISLLGAPVIRIAIEPVSGFAKVGIPRSIANKLRNTAATTDFQDSVTVGQGPNHLEPTPELEIRVSPHNVQAANYLRSEAYYSFTNHRWSAMRAPTELQDTQPGAATVQSIPVISRQEELSFDLRPRKAMHYLPTPGFVTTWQGSPPVRPLPDGRIEESPPLIDQIVSGQSVIAAPGIPVSADPEELPAMCSEAKIVGTLSPRVTELLRRTIQGATSDYDKAEKIREKIARTIVYNINAPAIPADADPLEDVLFDHPQAYCDMYATAMTLMARSAGIPARFVEGYRINAAYTDRDGWTVVLESDRHAWSELFFKDFGWVIFDATDGAESVPDGGVGATNSGGSFWNHPWVAMTLDALIGLGILAGLFIGLRSLATAKGSATPRRELDRVYIRFTRILERRMKARRLVSATPDEFLESARPSLGGAYPLAQKLTRRFVRHFYSPDAATDRDVALARQDVQELARMLKSEHSARSPESA
jgi:hypothetical protein